MSDYCYGFRADLQRLHAELDPGKVDRDQLQRILGIGRSVFTVEMGGPETTDQIMTALGLPFDRRITQEAFPLEPSEIPWEDEVEIIEPGCRFNEEEGLEFIEYGEFDRPTYGNAIRFAQQHRGTTAFGEEQFLIFLNKGWRDPHGNRHIICLGRPPDAERRGLYLRRPDFKFTDRCVLAAVRRKRPPTS